MISSIDWNVLGPSLLILSATALFVIFIIVCLWMDHRITATAYRGNIYEKIPEIKKEEQPEDETKTRENGRWSVMKVLMRYLLIFATMISVPLAVTVAAFEYDWPSFAVALALSYCIASVLIVVGILAVSQCVRRDLKTILSMIVRHLRGGHHGNADA